jgi:hypothetical protein
VQDDGDVEFGALQAVGGVDPDHCGGSRGSLCQGLADLVGLIAVRDSDRDVLWAERLSAWVPFACADSPAGQQPGRQGGDGVGGLTIGAGRVAGGQLMQRPAGSRGQVQGRIGAAAYPGCCELQVPVA